MQRLFNIIAQIQPGESSAASAASQTAGIIVIALCMVGLCILVTWLVRFGGFAALRKAPTRRHRGWFIFCPLGILFFWFVSMSLAGTIINAVFRSQPREMRETISYPVNAVLEIARSAAMLTIAHKAFARRLKGFGIKPGSLIKDIPFSFMHLLAVFPLIQMGLWAILVIGHYFKGPDFELDVHQSLDLLTEAGVGTQIIVAIFAVVIVPIFEELLFRGFFQTSLSSDSGKPWVAIVVTSAFFALMHVPNYTHMPALFFLSCGLGYAYERSGSLFRPILMHVFFNGFSVAVTLLQTQEVR